MLGGIPAHTALPPRSQLSALLLCPVLLQGTFARKMWNERQPAERSLSSCHTHLSCPNQKRHGVLLVVDTGERHHTLAGAQ